ncbi:MAG: hypothetical protein NWE94_05690 [Candidatus Bathyarchaeota archaeon]|nr:hypothetical protein [Candidatus Bathyarchaeota archaeon]
MLSTLVTGLSSPKAAIRYGCAKILMDLSAEYSEELYPYMDEIVAL